MLQSTVFHDRMPIDTHSMKSNKSVSFMLQYAAVAVKNSNAEAAMEWVFAHMEDPDFNEPLPAPPPAPAAAAGGGGGGGQAVDPGKVMNLGFYQLFHISAQSWDHNQSLLVYRKCIRYVSEV